MQRFFIYMAYDGANYHGWQIQPNGISVQECLERALSTILRRPINVVGAGRTDTGVHALLMVAHFDYIARLQESEIEELDTFTLTDRLNSLLPSDISIYKVCKVIPDAHARFNALSRTYKYYITTVKSPFYGAYRCRIFNRLDFDKMNEAAALLLNYVDFTSFSKLHTDAKTNNCHIMQAEWVRTDDSNWVFTIRADRFLRNMVRAIVGTLIEVGRGKLTIDGFRRVIEQRDRCKAGMSVPGQGLFLVDIEYPTCLFIEK